MAQALEGTTGASTVYGSSQILPLSDHGASGSLLQSGTASIQHSSGSGPSVYNCPTMKNQSKTDATLSREGNCTLSLQLACAVWKGHARGYCADSSESKFLPARIS